MEWSKGKQFNKFNKHNISTRTNESKVSVLCFRISLGAVPNTGFQFGRRYKRGGFYEGHEYSE